jgi:hypothetical protein
MHHHHRYQKECERRAYKKIVFATYFMGEFFVSQGDENHKGISGFDYDGIEHSI